MVSGNAHDRGTGTSYTTVHHKRQHTVVPQKKELNSTVLEELFKQKYLAEGVGEYDTL